MEKNGLAGKDGVDGTGITTTQVDSAGNLIVTLSDGSIQDAGVVKGKDGVDGTGITTTQVDSAGNLIVTAFSASCHLRSLHHPSCPNFLNKPNIPTILPSIFDINFPRVLLSTYQGSRSFSENALQTDVKLAVQPEHQII
jgi:hypothetical protein